MSEAVFATPFHARSAVANTFNRWTMRNKFTLAEDYGDPQDEALIARTRVVIADISWRWRIFAQGGGAAQLMSRLITRDPATLEPGAAFKALWLNDGGAVRGAGVVSRFASDSFLLASAAADVAWLATASAPFGVTLRDVTRHEGGIALIGPYAAAVLRAAGLDADIAPLSFRKLFWRGLDVTLSRWGEQNGYEIWCASDDCYLLWDRLMRAGAQYGIRPAGIAAMDILDVEAGVPRPMRDYHPATDGFAFDPAPASLGLESLIDEHHVSFNGRAAWLATRARSKTVLAGIEIDSETPASFAALLRDGSVAGHTLTSVHSPVLRRAIAFAQVERASAASGTEFTVTLPVSLETPVHRTASARVVDLPFVELREPFQKGEGAEVLTPVMSRAAYTDEIARKSAG